MFLNLKSLLPKCIKRAGIDKKVEDVKAINIFNEIKDKLLREDLAKKVRPMYLRGGKLVVASLSSQAAQRLQEKEAEIIKEINGRLGGPAVKKLKCLT